MLLFLVETRKNCDSVASEINQSLPRGSGSAIGIACHIRKKNDLEHLVNRTKEKLGNIDILVCNAAVNPFMVRCLKFQIRPMKKF